MEGAQEEKNECNQGNENFSSSDEPGDWWKSHTGQNSDESEEKLRTFEDMKKDEQDNTELKGDPNESSPIAASDDGVTNEKFDCKVCGKEFLSLKAVYGHMRLHSGKKRAAEVGSNGSEEEGSHSLRTKKHASTTSNPPRTPDSGSPQNPFSNGGEASTSRPMERERSSSERDVDVAHPTIVQAPFYSPVYDPNMSEVAQYLLLMSNGAPAQKSFR